MVLRRTSAERVRSLRRPDHQPPRRFRPLLLDPLHDPGLRNDRDLYRSRGYPRIRRGHGRDPGGREVRRPFRSKADHAYLPNLERRGYRVLRIYPRPRRPAGALDSLSVLFRGTSPRERGPGHGFDPPGEAAAGILAPLLGHKHRGGFGTDDRRVPLRKLPPMDILRRRDYHYGGGLLGVRLRPGDGPGAGYPPGRSRGPFFGRPGMRAFF